MRYTYIAAWSVLGGAPPAGEALELLRSDDCRFVLTRDPDPLLAPVDVGVAIRRLMLKALGTGRADARLSSLLALQIEELRAERARRVGARPVIAIVAHGEVDVPLDKPIRDFRDFAVTFGAVDVASLGARHRRDVEAMQLALAFEAEIPWRFERIAEGAHLHTAAGKPLYSIALAPSSDGTPARPLPAAAAGWISARYRALREASGMASVERLVSRMGAPGSDRLEAFLVGWTALEILVAGCFDAYEETLLAPMAEAARFGYRERFLRRVRGVMKGKYRLADKFLLVSALLFPGAPDAQAQEDFEAFERLKDVRDAIHQGAEMSDGELPVEELAALLRRYVIARLEAIGPSRERAQPVPPAATASTAQIGTSASTPANDASPVRA